MPSSARAASIGGSTMSTPMRHVGHALGPEDRRDLAGGGPEQAGVRGDRAAQADHPGVDVLLAQPRAVEPVVLGGRAEVPDVRIAAARQQRVAGHLVARPLADVGARDVADVVEVEQQDRAEVGGGQRVAGARRAVGAQPLDVPALFPVDVHRAGRGESVTSRQVPNADRSMTCESGVGRSFIHATHGRGCASRLAAPSVGAVPECALTLRKVAIRLDTCSLSLHTRGIADEDRWRLWRRVTCALIRSAGSA